MPHLEVVQDIQQENCRVGQSGKLMVHALRNNHSENDYLIGMLIQEQILLGFTLSSCAVHCGWRPSRLLMFSHCDISNMQLVSTLLAQRECLFLHL